MVTNGKKGNVPKFDRSGPCLILPVDIDTTIPIGKQSDQTKDWFSQVVSNWVSNSFNGLLPPDTAVQYEAKYAQGVFNGFVCQIGVMLELLNTKLYTDGDYSDVWVWCGDKGDTPLTDDIRTVVNGMLSWYGLEDLPKNLSVFQRLKWGALH